MGQLTLTMQKQPWGIVKKIIISRLVEVNQGKISVSSPIEQL